jgi:uncharacterized membrane protein YdbT with pleckstrin-like domain
MPQRNSPWLIASRFVGVLKSSWPVYAALVAFLLTAPHGLLVWIQLFTAYYTWTRLYTMFYEWMAVTFEVTPSGVQFHTGLFEKSTTHITWPNVRLVETSDNPILRAGHCVELDIHTMGGSTQSYVLSAIKASQAQEILALVARASPAARIVSDDDPQEDDPQETEDTVSQSSTLGSPLTMKDHVLIGFTHGKFLLFAAFAYSVYSFLSESLNQNVTVLGTIDAFERLSPEQHALAVAVFIPGSLLYGAAVSWLQLARLTVTRSPDGFTCTNGLFERSQKFIPESTIDVIVIRQNILMRMFDRYQMQIITTTSRGSSFARAILPIASRARIEDAAADIMEVSLPPARRLRASRVALVAVWLIAAALGTAFIAAQGSEFPRVLALTAWAAALTAAAVAAAVLSGRIVVISGFSSDRTYAVTGVLGSREFVLKERGIHARRRICLRLPWRRRPIHRTRIWFRSRYARSVSGTSASGTPQTVG